MVRTLCYLISFFWLLALSHVAYAQISIPYVDCGSDAASQPGQTISSEKTIKVDLPPAIAKKLAYYYFYGDFIIAPRGWVCNDKNVSGTAWRVFSVYPKNHTRTVYAISSATVADTTIGDQAYIYDWAKTYFPSFVPEIYDTGLGILSGRGQKGDIPRFSSDTLKYTSPSRVTYVTPAFRNGIGLKILSEGMYTPISSSSQSVPIQGFIEVATTPDDGACALFLYALALPPSLFKIAPYLLANKGKDVDSLIQSDNAC